MFICSNSGTVEVGGFCMLKQHTITATFKLIRTFLSFEGFHQHEMVSLNYHDFILMKRKYCYKLLKQHIFMLLLQC